MKSHEDAVYYTAADVAELVQLSMKTIYRLAAEDPTFPSMRLGGRRSSIRFPRDRVMQWFRDREQRVGAP